MAVARKKSEFDPVTEFDDWYKDPRITDPRTGALGHFALAECANNMWKKFEDYKREHLGRTQNYEKYETMADAEVVSQKPDLPNVSSGDIAGMVRRIARNVVQNTPNVEIISEFDKTSPKGILAKHMLKHMVIGDGLYSNDMQQNLFSSVMSSFTLGFEAVCPILLQRADGSWVVEYDVIHYQDVFPEPGAKDARKATDIFVRRYLTKGEVHSLIRNQTSGWDILALKRLLDSSPPPRQRESVPHQNKKHKSMPSGYEIITWYSNSGDPFLTFDAHQKMLLRIEKNKDPLKRHPVQMLVLEKDPLQPLGKSQISLVFGRQEFQDLMLNGAMKLWYKNINPTIVGYGTGLNGIPNMSPGKYTNIPNPNARVEAFETNTQTLLQYNSIAQANQGNMINLVGAADPQMAASAGSGMSATPQGVDAQAAMVDITTNNYQKSVENFFSRYCSYALTMYFAEMKGIKTLVPEADTRQALIDAGMSPDEFNPDGSLKIDLKDMAIEYTVACVPGSLVEMEEEKQLRLLGQLFVPLSQAMPALAATQDPEILMKAAAAMQFIIEKTVEMSGSNHADQLAMILREGPSSQIKGYQDRVDGLEKGIGELVGTLSESNETMSSAVQQLQEQVATLTQMNTELFQKLGISSESSAPPAAGVEQASVTPLQA